MIFHYCLLIFSALLVSLKYTAFAEAGNEKRGVNGGLDCARYGGGHVDTHEDLMAIKSWLANVATSRGTVHGKGFFILKTLKVCTVVLGLASQVAQIHNDSIVEASVKLCGYLPSSAASTCSKAVRILEPVLLDGRIQQFLSPDVICYGVGLCYKDPGEKYCHLFPKPKIGFSAAVKNVQRAFQEEIGPSSLTWDLCLLPGIKDICAAFNKSINQVQPALDGDNDWFSIVQSARGTFWRGRDCNDLDALTYPGRRPIDGDAGFDSNCNGISGRNTATGQPLEEQLCEGTGARGIIFMGDSVGAHFHYPEVWMDPLQLSKELVTNVSRWVLNEGDWPHLGFATGYTNTSQPALIQGFTDSIYLRMRQINRCNHRDYQNLSRNGAASNTVLRYMQSVARNASRDRPALAIYGLFGNDVCNNFKDTVGNMTTPAEFRSNVLEVLQFLDTVLPSGSHVLLIGLVDGSFIYPTMVDRIHPLGRLHNNIKYADMYKWFSCMQIGPCNGWMTPDSNLRKITSKASAKLSGVLRDLASSQRFSSFELHYLDNPLAQVMWEWQQKGKPTWQLIDPIDSLHPSQLAQPLITDVLWRNIKKKFPHILGNINPNNERIKELFGEQGGH